MRSWAACGVIRRCFYTNVGPRTEGVGNRATGDWSGSDHRPRANVAAEEFPSSGSGHVRPTSKGGQRRECHLRMERTSNRDLRRLSTRTRTQRGSTQATAGSTFNPSIFRPSYRRTNLGHERTDEPCPAHAHQIKVLKGIERTTLNTRLGFPLHHDRMPSPDRPDCAR